MGQKKHQVKELRTVCLIFHLLHKSKHFFLSVIIIYIAASIKDFGLDISTGDKSMGQKHSYNK